MKTDLVGLARNIKSCIDPKKDVGGWAGMIDQMVAYIRKLETVAAVASMIQDEEMDAIRVYLENSGWTCEEGQWWRNQSVIIPKGRCSTMTAIDIELDLALNALDSSC